MRIGVAVRQGLRSNVLDRRTAALYLALLPRFAAFPDGLLVDSRALAFVRLTLPSLRGDVLRSEDISLVLFDLGGVVCGFLPERRLERLSLASGKPPGLIQELWDSGFAKSCDRGDVGGAEMHQRVCELLAWRAGYAEFRAAWASAFEPDSSVLALVHALRRHHKTGLLTDNPPVIRDALRHELGDVGAAFDFLGFSCELRSLKPDPAVFRAALERADATPEATLFVDDVRANVEAAEALGIATLLFTGAPALASDLAGFSSWPAPGGGPLRRPARR